MRNHGMLSLNVRQPYPAEPQPMKWNEFPVLDESWNVMKERIPAALELVRVRLSERRPSPSRRAGGPLI